MTNSRRVKITTLPEDLVEGLFGQVLLWVFEILPYLDEQGMVPEWEIRSKLYGDPAQGFIVIPGLLEPNYRRDAGGREPTSVKLLHLRDQGTVTLGNDWDYLSELWLRYFSIPERIIERADGFPNLGVALGLHYRGTDKNKAVEETNYVSENNFLRVTDDFIDKHPEIKRIFLASDENEFIERVRLRYPNHDVIESGPVVHHKDTGNGSGFEKGDHALLDCLLLSRCRYLVKCQSALSGFAKVLNPKLEAYRISANKLTPWAKEIPYFPDGFLPKYQSERPECKKVLEHLFVDDWTENSKVVGMYGPLFRYRRREGNTRRHALMRRIWYGCARRLELVRSRLRENQL